MSLKKLEHPLNAAVLLIGAISFVYAVSATATAVLWSKSINCASIVLPLFSIVTLSLAVLTLYFLRQNAKKAVRDRLNYWTLLSFIPAVLILALLELYSSYLLNTTNVSRNRLNEFYYKELNEELLCGRFMSGENPQAEPYLNGSAEEILKSGKVPRFRGVYSGDFSSSFSDGGKVYLKLGRYALDKLKDAAQRRNSKDFEKYAKLSSKIIYYAARGIRDPERAAIILAKEFTAILQDSVTTNFPETENFDNIVSSLNDLRERFEDAMLGNIIYDTQSTLNRYDALLSKPSSIGQVLDTELSPVWSDTDIIAGKLFPSARRLRLINDYTAAVGYLHICRSVGTSIYSAANSRLEVLNNKLDEMKKNRHFAALAFVPDFRRGMMDAAWEQHRIENACLAGEIEVFRRVNKRLPKNFEEVQSHRLMTFPNGHIEGSKYTLLKGRFKDKSGNEYAGYALTVPTGSFVITDRK